MLMNTSESDTSLTNIGHDSVVSNEQLVFYFLSLFLGVSGNVLALVVILSEKKRVKINDIYITNLAVADLTFLVVRLPVKIYESMRTLKESWIYCKMISPSVTVTVSVSAFTMSCMAMHRCRVMLNPLRLISRRRYAFLSVIIVWILAFLVALPLAIVSSPNENGKCQEKWPSFRHRQVYTVSLFVIQYLLPLFIIAVAYISISRDLMNYKTERHGSRVDVKYRRNCFCRRQENIQVIKTLAAIVILFAIFMLPNHIAWIILDFSHNVTIAEKIFSFSDILMYVHSCVNPVVYGTITRRFRQKYIKYFCYIVSWMALLPRWWASCRCRCYRLCSSTVKDNKTTFNYINKGEDAETKI